MLMGVVGASLRGIKGKNWDNCNSIINKCILLQGGHTKGSEIYEKMLSIGSHQRDAN